MSRKVSSEAKSAKGLVANFILCLIFIALGMLANPLLLAPLVLYLPLTFIQFLVETHEVSKSARTQKSTSRSDERAHRSASQRVSAWNLIEAVNDMADYNDEYIYTLKMATPRKAVFSCPECLTQSKTLDVCSLCGYKNDCVICYQPIRSAFVVFECCRSSVHESHVSMLRRSCPYCRSRDSRRSSVNYT